MFIIHKTGIFHMNFDNVNISKAEKSGNDDNKKTVMICLSAFDDGSGYSSAINLPINSD